MSLFVAYTFSTSVHNRLDRATTRVLQRVSQAMQMHTYSANTQHDLTEPKLNLNRTPNHHMHVTLQFLGHIPTHKHAAHIVRSARDSLEKHHTSFPRVRSLHIEQARAFPSLQNPRVLAWQISASRSLLAAHEHIAAVLHTVPLSKTAPLRTRHFIPHITFARIHTSNATAAFVARALRLLREERVYHAQAPHTFFHLQRRIRITPSTITLFASTGAPHRIYTPLWQCEA